MRKLCTDQDEALFDAQRPVILNGIADFVTRPDLTDRALLLTLEPLSEKARMTEAELWAAFEAKSPTIFGALLDAVKMGLKRMPSTKLETLPRMADFAQWATACETACWLDGTFLAAYSNNQDEAVDSVIEAGSVTVAIRDMMEPLAEWTGTATDLLAELDQQAGERAIKSRTWPKNPRALSDSVRRAATGLRKIGIEIIMGAREGRSRARTIHISKGTDQLPLDNKAQPASRPSAPSVEQAWSSSIKWPYIAIYGCKGQLCGPCGRCGRRYPRIRS